jgi:hypothetical protein
MKKYGFTIIELLLVVVTFVLLMVAFVVPAFNKTRQERLNLEKHKPVTAEQEQQIAVERQIDMEKKLTQIQDCGNGVYYFPFVGLEYSKILSKFLDLHTNLEPVFSDGDVVKKNRWSDNGGRDTPNSDYGATIGRTVFFREKRAKQQ